MGTGASVPNQQRIQKRKKTKNEFNRFSESRKSTNIFKMDLPSRSKEIIPRKHFDSTLLSKFTIEDALNENTIIRRVRSRTRDLTSLQKSHIMINSGILAEEEAKIPEFTDIRIKSPFDLVYLFII